MQDAVQKDHQPVSYERHISAIRKEKITAMRSGVPPVMRRTQLFRGLSERQSGCDRLRLNARDGVFLTHTAASWTAA